MSRIGKKSIAIPQKTEATFSGGMFHVKGPHGELSRKLRPEIEVTIADGEISLLPKRTTIETRSLWGTYASHIENMIQGVNQPYQKNLIIEGVGYKWNVQGDMLDLSLGFSHPIKRKIPQGVTVKIDKNTMSVSGIDKELVGQFAAEVRKLKEPEPYKGKGIRYDTEVIRRKQGKKAA